MTGNFDKHADAAQMRDHPELTAQVPRGCSPAKKKRQDSSQPVERALNGEESLSSAARFSVPATLVQFMSVVSGHVEITEEAILFIADVQDREPSSADELYDNPDFRLPFSKLRELHGRRYNLRSTGLELFSIDQTNYLINFSSTDIRDKVYSNIQAQDTPALIYAGVRSGANLLVKSGLIKRWRERKISNFEYLMQLNTLAGRTYNDLNQYPIFPWILADYTSETLDLTSPDSFRDLTRPAGALNDKRREFLKMMYEQMGDDPGMGRFHYGTHYSNAAYVLHYLLRIEPYTSLHIELQSGKFDHADRQFRSVPTTWQSISEGSSDVKELIPEFFFLPEMFENTSGFDLGHLQTGESIETVELPKWAKDPHHFVHMHRAALESEYVSMNLHNWIDLIFGYKQTGPAAEEAVNCFMKSCYEKNLKELDDEPDPRQRQAREDMIREFGQTPSQLLATAHPARRPLKDGDGAPEWLLNSAYFVELSSCDPVTALLVPSRGDSLAEWMKSGLAMKLVTLSDRGLAATHDWLPQTSSKGRPFTLDADLAVRRFDRHRVGDGLLDLGRKITSRLCALTPDNSCILMAGFWDCTVKVLKVVSTNLTRAVVVHSCAALRDIATCLAIDVDGSTVVVGYRDGTCSVFNLTRAGDLHPTGEARSPTTPTTPTRATGSGRRLGQHKLEGPAFTLYGHSAEVTQVVTRTEVDMILTASRDGTVNMHTIRQPKFVRAIRPAPPDSVDETVGGGAVEMVTATPKGDVFVTYSTWKDGAKRRHGLHAFSINGKLLAVDYNCGVLTEMVPTPSGKYFITAKRKGLVCVRLAHTLEVVQTMTTNKNSIRSMVVSSNESHLFLGLADGKLVIVPQQS